MVLKRGSLLLLALSLMLCVYAIPNRTVLAVDGTHPPAPPLPWAKSNTNATVLTADGTHPPAPPLPWAKNNTNVTVLTADGTHPPAPPLLWAPTRTQGNAWPSLQ